MNKRLTESQLRAAFAVNKEFTYFYWQLGREIINKQKQFKWGDQFLTQFSDDLRKAVPGLQGFSVTNLKRMRLFAQAYPNFEIGAQLLSDSFDKDHFVQWLKEVKTVSAKSGYLSVALTQIGKVLFYTPPDDKSGFWINASAADALNDKNAQKIRDGFCLAIYNSRGAHWVDPTGKPEKELAAKYKKQAEEAEAEGYQRLAVSLQSIANSYEKEAISIQEKN